MADRFAEYKSRTEGGEESGAVLDSLGFSRYCCRRMLFTSVETIRQIVPFYEAIEMRRREVQSELD